MVRDFRTFEHTADIGLEGHADSLGQLFEAMGEGLVDVISPHGSAEKRKKLEIRVQADDVESLMVDFLSEVLRLFTLDKFIVADIKVGQINETSVVAEVAGEPYDPERHGPAEEIKAVTYHRLKVAQEGDEWIASVILDV